MAIYNERIKKLRQDSDMTLKYVADKMNITEATAQRYESGNGIKEIPYAKVLAYADLFGVTPNYIMGFESDPLPKQIEECLKIPELKMRLLAFAEKILEVYEIEHFTDKKED